MKLPTISKPNRRVLALETGREWVGLAVSEACAVGSFKISGSAHNRISIVRRSIAALEWENERKNKIRKEDVNFK